MKPERLVAMANDIAAFFASEPGGAAAAQHVAAHLQRYWDPRMRRELRDHVQSQPQGLHPLALAAVQQLRD